MWNRLGLVLLVVLAVLAVAVYQQRQAENAGAGPRLRLNFERSAEGVVLREISPDGRKPMVVTAVKVIENSDRKLWFEDFSVQRDGDTFVKGRLADYDLSSGLLNVRERVVIRRGPASELRLDGLVWDRQTASGRTDKPLDLTVEGGTLRADRAEFENDFNDIHLIGGVHAKIATDQLDFGL